MRDEAVSHMRCWVGLAQHALSAEFPSFDLAQAMSAFDLRTRGGGAPRGRQLVLTPLFELGNRVQDAFLAACICGSLVHCCQSLGRSQWPIFVVGCVGRRHRQHAAHAGRLPPNAQILYFMQRRMCFLPATYGIEQSFSRIAGVLGDKRLNVSMESEQRSARLLVSSLTPLEVARLGAEASKVRSYLFPEQRARTHKRKRIDEGMRRRKRAPPQQTPRQQPTEKHFLERLRAKVGSRVASSSTACPSSLAPLGDVCGGGDGGGGRA